jgi:hypothetical protein
MPADRQSPLATAAVSLSADVLQQQVKTNSPAVVPQVLAVLDAVRGEGR